MGEGQETASYCKASKCLLSGEAHKKSPSSFTLTPRIILGVFFLVDRLNCVMEVAFLYSPLLFYPLFAIWSRTCYPPSPNFNVRNYFGHQTQGHLDLNLTPPCCCWAYQQCAVFLFARHLSWCIFIPTLFSPTPPIPPIISSTRCILFILCCFSRLSWPLSYLFISYSCLSPSSSSSSFHSDSTFFYPLPPPLCGRPPPLSILSVS